MTDRARLLRWAGPALLVVALGIAWLLPAPDWLRLAAPDRGAADRMTAALDALSDEPSVLVGFDPDLGTYAEVRPTVRALLGDLLERGARLTFVSLTAEGRALAIAELDRLDRGGVEPSSLADLGFVTGAEAGLVDLSAELASRHDAIVVVGGNDLGPRSWVEQVLPRVDDLPMLAVTPAILLPEVQPYLGSGQVDAALLTPRDGAAYRSVARLGGSAAVAEGREPAVLSILLGMLAAAVVLGHGLTVRAAGALRAMPGRDA